MRKSDIAIQFLNCFCNADLSCLELLLASNLTFKGPLLEVDDRAGYLAKLHEDPPVPASYEIISVAENESDCFVFYKYNKPNETIRICQFFRFDSEEKICQIALYF